ncbi:uncharacterized protein LOC111704170 [Eurytemora carolleeae]|uniref:uncharacterized protein LOC111704170 n=1 Tax=Eurytemora carolleeae TaxID=1294199 RepID=UPI000C75C0BD|nr:uncharacterized protein LOC111704170 [Eurytemora carolleeae]|eukprot:XP_023332091.1 uncharacterized protein LOC111704170 [Eurytemora affinis]
MDSIVSEEIDKLCLDKQLTKDVQHKLGEVSKKSTPPSPVLGVKPRVKITKPSADSGLASTATRSLSVSNIPANSTDKAPSCITSETACNKAASSSPPTPANSRKQQKKNRKDRRRGNGGDDCGIQASRAEKLRHGVERSNSAHCVASSRLPSQSSEEISQLLFKSQTSINLNAGLQNLPDSFFSDELPEDIKIPEPNRKEKKKRKGKKKEGKKQDEEKRKEEAEDEEKKGEEDVKVHEGPLEDVVEYSLDEQGDDDGDDEKTVYNWRNVTTNGDVKKCILVEGSREEGRPMRGDIVLVKSQGKLKDGTMVDDIPSLVFRVGEYEVVEGLDLVVQSMFKNELSIVSVKPKLAYGDLGRSPDIPTNARITYLFGLLHFEKQKQMSEMTWAQRRKMGQSRMRIANWWYSRKDYTIAVKCYKKALLFYNNIPTDQKCSTPEEYRELLALMEERLRVMRQVANIFKRIANIIQNEQLEL